MAATLRMHKCRPCVYILQRNTMSQRGGLTPACGFTGGRNGRGCRQIKTVNAAVLCQGLEKRVPWLSQVEQRKSNADPVPSTQHRALSENMLKAHHGACILTQRRAVSIFSPCLFCLLLDLCMFVREVPPPPESQQ